MRPKDFWRLTPAEFFALLDLKAPRRMFGSMTEAQVAQIYLETYGEDEEE